MKKIIVVPRNTTFNVGCIPLKRQGSRRTVTSLQALFSMTSSYSYSQLDHRSHLISTYSAYGIGQLVNCLCTYRVATNVSLTQAIRAQPRSTTRNKLIDCKIVSIPAKLTMLFMNLLQMMCLATSIALKHATSNILHTYVHCELCVLLPVQMHRSEPIQVQTIQNCRCQKKK